jgi:hypothetical protein
MIGDAMPMSGKSIMYNTILLYDARPANELRLQRFPQLNADVLSTVTGFLDKYNSLYIDYRRGFTESGSQRYFTFSIQADNTKQYSSQRADTLGVVYGLPDTQTVDKEPRHVLTVAKGTGKFNSVRFDNPNYEAAVYPLVNMLAEPSYATQGRIVKGKSFKDRPTPWCCETCQATFLMKNDKDWHTHWAACHPTVTKQVTSTYRSPKRSTEFQSNLHQRKYLEFTKARNVFHVDLKDFTPPAATTISGFFSDDIAEAYVSEAAVCSCHLRSHELL